MHRQSRVIKRGVVSSIRGATPGGAKAPEGVAGGAIIWALENPRTAPMASAFFSPRAGI